MDPTLIDLLTASSDGDARAKAQVLAAQLRGDKTLGMMGLGGGRLAAPAGKAMLADAAGGDRDMLAAGIANQRSGQEARQFRADQSRMGLESKERLAAMNDARMREIAALRAMTAGAPKPEVARPTKPLPGKEADTLQEMNTTLRNVNDIAGKFQKKYAGQSLPGRAVNWVGRIFGSAAPEAMQEQNAFWAAFKELYELPARHKFFGSALTPTEAKSWAEAQNLGPGTSPEIIEAKFKWMQDTARTKLTQRAGARKVEGVYSGDAIDAMTDELGGSATPAAGVRKFTRVNGKLVEVK